MEKGISFHFGCIYENIEEQVKASYKQMVLNGLDGQSGLNKMTEEQLSHITEPFYRTDNSRSRGEGGTGLGLALCKRIAEAHGGELVFESLLHKGTTAYLNFTSLLQLPDNSITTP